MPTPRWPGRGTPTPPPLGVVPQVNGVARSRVDQSAFSFKYIIFFLMQN